MDNRAKWIRGLEVKRKTERKRKEEEKKKEKKKENIEKGNFDILPPQSNM